jgi:uncharacterized protein YjiS (DUF1127 family)
MAVLDYTRSAHASTGGFAPLAFVISGYAAWRDARQTLKALSSLSDRELEDIGLCRGDIDAIASNGKV